MTKRRLQNRGLKVSRRVLQQDWADSLIIVDQTIIIKGPPQRHREVICSLMLIILHWFPQDFMTPWWVAARPSGEACFTRRSIFLFIFFNFSRDGCEALWAQRSLWDGRMLQQLEREPEIRNGVLRCREWSHATAKFRLCYLWSRTARSSLRDFTGGGFSAKNIQNSCSVLAVKHWKCQQTTSRNSMLIAVSQPAKPQRVHISIVSLFSSWVAFSLNAPCY